MDGKDQGNIEYTAAGFLYDEVLGVVVAAQVVEQAARPGAIDAAFPVGPRELTLSAGVCDSPQSSLR